MQFQWKLSLDEPLNRVMIPSSHNSAITYADGYGYYQAEIMELFKQLLPRSVNPRVQISNHWLSVTDQLRMGIKHLEIDVHWFLGEARICHASNLNVPQINDFVKFIEQYLNIKIEWNSQKLGCWGLDLRTFTDSMVEIKQWMDKNPGDVVIIYIDNDPDFLNWGKVNSLLNPIKSVFGNLTFTPKDKQQRYPNSWPTPRELLNANKKIMFASRFVLNAEYGETVFQPPYWNEGGTRQFKPFPDCTPFNTPFSFRRIVDSAIQVGPFYNESNNLFSEKGIRDLSDCNIHYASMDVSTPDNVKGFIWSWAENEPKGNGCTLLDKRWRIEDCNQEHHVACQDEKDFNKWVISERKGKWDIAPRLCPNGFKFSIPKNGYHNSILSKEKVWLNLKY